MNIGKDLEFRVGRRLIDGTVRLSPLPPQLLQLSVSYKGERASSVMLTRDQVQTLRNALAEFEQFLEKQNSIPESWDHNERRAMGVWTDEGSKVSV